MTGTGGPRRVLVAGIGNVFLGDDGFGVETVGRIDRSALPECVDVADYGIRGMHLAYDLLAGHHHTLIMVDAMPLDGPPGMLAVLEADPVQDAAPPVLNGHGMHPQAVLHLLHTLGGRMSRVLVVGCRPAGTEERMGLSAPVAAAVDEAARLTTELAVAAARGEAEPRGTEYAGA